MSEKESKMTMKILTTWDLTIKASTATPEEIRNIFKNKCSSWVFQREKGEKTGLDHYQARIRVAKKCREPQIVQAFKETKIGAGMYIRPTTTLVHKSKTFNYVLKEDTRIEGPWKDTDPEPEELPYQLEDITELLPFQKSIMENILNQKIKGKRDMRSINVLYSKEGKIGGSVIRDWMMHHKLATPIPAATEPKDLCQAVMSMPPDTGYFVDMPRNMKRKKVEGFWAGIESIKDGYCYDHRYKFKQRLQSRPAIWVKTNEWPDLSAMSDDRWKIWGVDKTTKELIPLVSPPTTVPVGVVGGEILLNTIKNN